MLARVGANLELLAMLMQLKNQLYLSSVRLLLGIIQYFNVAVT